MTTVTPDDAPATDSTDAAADAVPPPAPPPAGADPHPGSPGRDALAWVPIDRLVPNPDNVRTGKDDDLDGLVRSVKAHGVLEPLVVLPADAEGRHLLVAGHRRLRAAEKAGVAQLPVRVRALSPAGVVEAMLIENLSRSDLRPTDEVAAIERLLALDPRLSATKLAKRIGRSAGWCRTRLALVVLPPEVRSLLDGGT